MGIFRYDLSWLVSITNHPYPRHDPSRDDRDGHDAVLLPRSYQQARLQEPPALHSPAESIDLEHDRQHSRGKHVAYDAVYFFDEVCRDEAIAGVEERRAIHESNGV